MFLFTSEQIAERIKSVCADKGVTIGSVLENASLGRNTMANFKTSMPKLDTLAKIADVLGCSLDFLAGRTDMAAENKNASAEGRLSEGNVVRLAGRDGSYFEKVLPDDLYEILKKFIDSLDEDHDPRL